MVFVDETGFSKVSPLKRTWAPVACTPVVKTAIDHYVRINVIGALTTSARHKSRRMLSRSHSKTITGQEVLAFHKQIVGSIAGAIVLVWDNHPIHRRKSVLQYLARNPRITFYALPRYAPELNPAEGIWTQSKEHTAGTAPKTMGELRRNVRTALRRTQRSRLLIDACFKLSGLDFGP